jgi:pSer/pThr/pTyr-binding forkhead associated (FHA) protein/limonene-1,2-epoxide hydrolase
MIYKIFEGYQEKNMKAVLHGPQGSTILETILFTFGSSPDNSLVIDNIKVSAHHAEIRSEENGYSIIDLGSIHGTYVNGERLDFNSPRLLHSGDSISIGDSVFRYDVEETSQIEESTPITHKQEGEDEVLSEENLANLPTARNNEIISESPQDQQLVGATIYNTLPQQYVPSNAQQLDSTLFIPPDFDGPIPGYMPLKEVRRRDRRLILIGLGLLVVIALAVGGYFYFNRSTPEKTLDAFCNAMQGQDYQTAYNQLSNSLQSSETELEFANTLRANGKVNTCTHSSANATNNKAAAKVTIVTNSGQASSSSIILTADSGNIWKLSLFPTTPSMTLTAFCNALQNKDYPTAYAQLTSGIKRLHAEAQFETDFASLTCSYSNLSSSGSTTSATMTFKTSSGQTANAKVALIQDGDSNNNWKIDSIQF